MGDPQPGQFADNVFMSVQQLAITGAKTGSEGDILYRPADDANWASVRVDTPTITAAIIARGIAQTRVDLDSTGVASGIIKVEAFTAPSYIFGVAGGVIQPGGNVTINTNGQFIATTTANLIVGKYSRLSVDSDGSTVSELNDIIVVKLGV